MMARRQLRNWSAQPEKNFIEEYDIDNNCTIDKILNNRFHDPLISSSDSDDEEHPPIIIDWDKILKNKVNVKNKLFVPCLRGVPPYPKLSALTSEQHKQFLKILSAENPKILEDCFIGEPKRLDVTAFEAMKETYENEQKEYIEWAKSLWTTDHCIRAIRPKPLVEYVYDAGFKIRAFRMLGFPKQYGIAAQIPLECSNQCDMLLLKEIISVNLLDMPQVKIPEKIEQQFSITEPCPVPKTCKKHTYRMILPNEESVSTLPITEVHQKLAQFAISHGVPHIASENALKCLMQLDRPWMLPLSVCETIAPDGERVNVLVLDSEFSTHKEPAPVRTMKAYRHLLEHALVPVEEREKVRQRLENCKKKDAPSPKEHNLSIEEDDDSDDDDGLVIDMGSDDEDKHAHQSSKKRPNTLSKTKEATKRRLSEDSGFTCTCKDTFYERPLPRSFKKWQFKNKQTREHYNIIIHCSHKARDKSNEILLEPIPEYQIDCGASLQSADSIRSLALSLALRKASVLNVRVDGSCGDVATFNLMSSEEFKKKYPEETELVAKTIYAILSQLQGLLPGHYLLQHESAHGCNALLLSRQPAHVSSALTLSFSAALGHHDETALLSCPPTLTAALLPYHKYRRILPCTFTPYENQVKKERKKPTPKKKAPHTRKRGKKARKSAAKPKVDSSPQP